MTPPDACRKDTTPQVLVLTAIALAVFAAGASTRIVDALLPCIARDFQQSIGTASATITAYALSYGGCQFLYGPLGDRLGPFRIVCWAAMLSAGAALCCAFAPSLALLVLSRLLAGAAAAAISPLALTWISHATSAEERPVVVAHMSCASILGGTAGQVGGGLIGQTIDWRACFVLTALVFACAGATLAWTGHRRDDLKMTGRIAPLKGAHREGVRQLLLRPAIRSTLLLVGIEGAATYMSLAYAAPMLGRRLGIGLAAAGSVIGFFGLGGVAFAFLAALIVRSLSVEMRALLGGAAAAAGFAVLMVVQTPVSAAACMFCTGLGLCALHNTLQVRATFMAPDAPAAAISLFAAVFFLGQASGAAIGGWTFDRGGPTLSFGMSATALLGIGVIVSRLESAGRRRADKGFGPAGRSPAPATDAD